MAIILQFICKMKFLEFFILTLAVMSLATCHPICAPACNSNIAANVQFVNEWLNHSSDAKGIHKLRNRKSTVVHQLLKDVNTKVINDKFLLCLYVQIIL